MSNRVSVLVYSRKIGSPVRKAVMVYFAERASDNGEGIWASKNTIADAVECGRSTVIRTINEFVAEGLLRVVGTRRCANGETIEYAIDLDALSRLDPVSQKAPAPTRPAAGPVPERDPSQNGTPPVPLRDPHPSRCGTQTTITTTKEPSKSNAREARETLEALCQVLSKPVAQSFIDHRKRKRAKLSPDAALLIAEKLAGHPDPDAVAKESIANGWTGIFPKQGASAAPTHSSTPRIRAKLPEGFK